MDALDGAPGVHSARFAGEPKSDERNNQRLLELLAHSDNRTRTLLLRHRRCCDMRDDPQPLIAEGEWHGEVLRAPRGTGASATIRCSSTRCSDMTGAELPMEKKNRISHRGKALTLLAERLGSLPLKQARQRVHPKGRDQYPGDLVDPVQPPIGYS